MSVNPVDESWGRGFSGLPVEIQHTICAQLCTHCSEPKDTSTFKYRVNTINLKALAALTKTSRTLRSIAQPMMYHRLPQHRNFKRMIQTLVDHPEFTACVKHYSQATYPGMGGWLNEEQFDFYKQLARDLHMDDPDDPEFYKADHEDLSAPKFCEEVLLALLPQTVESLNILVEDDGNYDGTSFPFLAIRFRHVGSPALPHLRKLRFDTEERYGVHTDNPGAMLILRNAPNLEYLEFNSTKGPELDWEDEDDNTDDMGEESGPLKASRVARIFPILSSLRTLKFTDSAFDGTVCCRLVKYYAKTSPQLDCFHFVDHSAWLGENEDMDGMRLALLKALLPGQKTLKTLALDLSHHSGPRYAHGDDAECRSILKDFSSLETLTIDEQVVCRHCSSTRWIPTTSKIEELPTTCLIQALPDSIRTVVIKVFANSHIWADLIALGQKVALGDFPKLRRITVKPEYRYGQDDRDLTFSELRDQAKEVMLEVQKHFANTAVQLEIGSRR